MKFIDLSLPIDDTAYEVHEVSIDRISHSAGMKKLNELMMRKTVMDRVRFLMGKRIIPYEYFKDGEFLSLETVNAAVHCGTHVDYTYHYGISSEGNKSNYIDALPLEWCYGPGVVLDFRQKKAGEVITATEVQEQLGKMRYDLRAGDIVLFYTGADRLFGKKEYFSQYPAIDVSTIGFLLDRRIKIFGVDTMGIDRPYPFMMKDFLRTHDASFLWPAHFFGRERAFAHIERLANLDKLPATGFTVSCFPVRIRKTGAAWCRAVAIIE